MKHVKKTLLLVGMLVVTGLVAHENENPGSRSSVGPGGHSGDSGPARQHRGPGPGGHRPPPPVIVALDANRDGQIDAQEIANAGNSLLTLDANGDGHLSGDELRPPCPWGHPPGDHPPRGERPGN